MTPVSFTVPRFLCRCILPEKEGHTPEYNVYGCYTRYTYACNVGMRMGG